MFVNGVLICYEKILSVFIDFLDATIHYIGLEHVSLVKICGETKFV